MSHPVSVKKRGWPKIYLWLDTIKVQSYVSPYMNTVLYEHFSLTAHMHRKEGYWDFGHRLLSTANYYG